MTYEPSDIEPKWQAYWDERGTFRTDTARPGPKFYVLDMFPYPSGRGLHVGHLKGYVASDIFARYKRMRGFNVLHPMGWDSFGLPTERQAERDGLHPAEVTRRNVGVFRKQLKLAGLSYDWSRELATSDPSYYIWTQWIFLRLLERGLAYQSDVTVNWCPALRTVLANEEVKDGVYVETGDPVEKRTMRQWILKITTYAERLANDLELVDWPESVKSLQRNWIGRSAGATIKFGIEGSSRTFEVFTTRPDTLFGCSFCVLAPEHPLVMEITVPAQKAEVSRYLAESAARAERDRIADPSRTGEFTGAHAINPADGRRVPIYAADYVVFGHGTGAVFGCPAHDERDYDFARKYELDVLPVVSGGDISQAAYVGDGPHINSDFLNGLNIVDAIARMTEWLEQRGTGRAQVMYHLRDWLFSRQRYWGEPIPVVHTQDDQVIPETRLPVLLPDSVPEGGADAPEAAAPLSRATEWLKTTAPDGRPARRETNVMPQWAGSCWYYLRFLDPGNAQAPFDPQVERTWMPVDLYLGGIEHATLHLLYARFWHKVLFDCALVSGPEPFARLFNQGMVHSTSYRDGRGKYYYPDQAEKRGDHWFVRATNEPLTARLEKMSKSRYNTVAPEDVVRDYGADSLRVYEAFMGPVQDSAIWQTDGLPGVRRFLDRSWKLFERQFEIGAPERGDASDARLERLLHQTIKKVSDDIESLHLNTVVSQLMIFVNEASRRSTVPGEILSQFVRLLAPFAPHMAEELWQRMGHDGSVAFAPWPEYDPAKARDDSVTIAVQVNGKRRSEITAIRGAEDKTLEALALRDPMVAKSVDGRVMVRVVHVPDRLINFVVK